jgi:hypothetical protein
MSANYPQIFKEYQYKIFILMKNVHETLQEIESRKQDTSRNVSTYTGVESDLRVYRRRIEYLSEQCKTLLSESNRHSLQIVVESLQKWIPEQVKHIQREELLNYPDYPPVKQLRDDWKNLLLFVQPLLSEVLDTLYQTDAYLKGASPSIPDDAFTSYEQRILEQMEAMKREKPRRGTEEAAKLRDFYLAWYYRHASEADQALIMQAAQADISESEILQEFLIRDYNRRNQAKGSILDQIRRSGQP